MTDSMNNVKHMCEDNFQHLMTLDLPLMALTISAIDWNHMDYSLKEREDEILRQQPEELKEIL